MQISELQGAVKYHNNIEEKLLSEKAALVKQVEAAQDQLARSQNRIDALEADNRRMLHVSLCSLIIITVVTFRFLFIGLKWIATRQRHAE